MYVCSYYWVQFQAYIMSAFFLLHYLNPKRCWWSVKEAGVVQKCPVRDSGLWTLQFSSKLNKQYLIWKLKSSAKIWDVIEVTEGQSLALGGFEIDRGQMLIFYRSRLDFWKTCQDSEKMTLLPSSWDIYG